MVLFFFFSPIQTEFLCIDDGYNDYFSGFTGCLAGLTTECQDVMNAVDECILDSDPDPDCTAADMCAQDSFNENNQVISSDFLNCLGELTHPTVVDAKACMDYFCGKKTFFFFDLKR